MATTKYIVDNVSGQTITGDLTINGNFVVTGTTNTRLYNVYTALLTQSGGTEVLSISSGELVIGATYEIVDNFQRDYICDFTNVGAPNNDIGTYFVATGTVPSNWGNGRLQYNTGAPVVTVLENTIGNLWWTFNANGAYSIYKDSNFVPEKTFVTLTNNTSGNITLTDGMALGFELYQGQPNIIINTTTEGSYANEVLYNTPFEIRVYN